MEQCQTRNLDQMWIQRPFVDATTFQPASCILATFHPPSFSPSSFFYPFVTSPHCPFPSVSPSNQTAAGPAEWCLGRRPGGCSGSVGRRLHHRLRPGLLLPPLLQQPRLLVGTTQHCTALNHVTPSSRMCVTVLPVSSTPEKKVDGRISLSFVKLDISIQAQCCHRQTPFWQQIFTTNFLFSPQNGPNNQCCPRTHTNRAQFTLSLPPERHLVEQMVC